MDAVSSKRILIVEDERDVIDLLTLNLRKVGGFAVSTASDGAAAPCGRSPLENMMSQQKCRS